MPQIVTILLTAITILMPSSVMAMSLGTFMIGEEGQAVWRIYSSPLSAQGLVKSKYFLTIFFALIVLLITGVFGIAFYHPSFRAAAIAVSEAVFLVFTLGAISLSNGISGADFTETPRPKLIRQSTSLLNIVECLLVGIAVLAPFIPYIVSSTISAFMPSVNFGAILDPALAAIISAVISVVLTAFFYRVSLRKARKLLAKAEI
jgi:uncharacterized protein YacL